MTDKMFIFLITICLSIFSALGQGGFNAELGPFQKVEIEQFILVGDPLTRTGDRATHSYTYDGNGNVSELVTSTGTLAGHYEYGPFGEPLRATGAMAAQNPFRFSTKYADNDAGLLYYGYRYYQPSTGRWINRDPFDENGGMNLYGYVCDDPMNQIDLLGLVTFSGSPEWTSTVSGVAPNPRTAVFTHTIGTAKYIMESGEMLVSFKNTDTMSTTATLQNIVPTSNTTPNGGPALPSVFNINVMCSTSTALTYTVIFVVEVTYIECGVTYTASKQYNKQYTF